MRAPTILTTLVLVSSLAGCLGADDDSSDDSDAMEAMPAANDNTTEPTESVVSVSLTGVYPATIAYEPAEITVDNGTRVNLTFSNSDTNPLPSHDWVLEGYEDNASTAVIANGETSTVSFTAPPTGTYAFYCSVPGHRGNGMEGTFVVA